MSANDGGRGLTRVDALAAVLAGALAAGLFAASLGHGFVNWDDGANFLSNPWYRGLGRAQLTWMFTSTHLGHWIPVTWLTFGLDYVLWGMDPAGYHLTNVLLHAVTTALFCEVARRLIVAAAPALAGGPATAGGAAAALFFALHPLRVESVAWVTERRDVLAGALLLAAVLAHLSAIAARGRARLAWRAASLGAYALALGAKSIVIALPALLLILDVYPLRRLALSPRTWRSPDLRALVLEKVPYAGLALVAGGAALYALHANAFLTPASQHSLGTRVAIAAYGLWFYAWKTLVPTALSPLHELPLVVALPSPRFLGSLLAVLAATLGFWVLRRVWPAGLAAWLVYVATLLPVSVRIHSGHQLVAERYSYFACLGWAVALGGVVAMLVSGGGAGIRPAMRRLALGGIALWGAGLAIMTTAHIPVWRDSESLWRQALTVDPDCANCRNGLGKVLATSGRLGAAIAEFEKGLALRPAHGAMILNLADTLLLARRHDEAVVRLRPVVERYPEDNEVRSRLAIALIENGERAEGAAQVERIFRSNPTSPVSFLNVGFALVRLDRPREAIDPLQRAAALTPSSADAHFWLARAHLRAGDRGRAQAGARMVRTLNPALADVLEATLRQEDPWPR